MYKTIIEEKNRVIFVLLDGLNYKNSEYMGYMIALEREGKAKFLKVLSEMPSLSKPLYETLLTGKKPIEHGVLNNGTPIMSKEKNIFSLCREAGLVTGVSGYYWLSELYNSIPFNKIKDTTTNDENKNIQHGRFYTLDHYPDEVVFVDGEYIREKYNPDFLMIHSMNIDDAGHKFGSDSKEYRYSVRVADNLLSTFVPKWIEEGYNIIVTSDHGMSVDGMHSGKDKLEAEVPLWVINDKKDLQLGEEIEQIYVTSIITSILGIGTDEMKKRAETFYRGY